MIRLDSDKRARLAAAKAEIAEILDPVKRVERKERRKKDREARQRVGKRDVGQRQPREHDPGYLAFVRRQLCAVAHLGGCEGPIEAAHIRYSDAKAGSRNPGMQAKNHDRFANPLCRHHHNHDQHKRKEPAFWSAAGINAYANAAELFAAYSSAKQTPDRRSRDAK